MNNPFPDFEPLIKNIVNVRVDGEYATVDFKDIDGCMCTLHGPKTNTHIIAVIHRFERQKRELISEKFENGDPL